MNKINSFILIKFSEVLKSNREGKKYIIQMINLMFELLRIWNIIVGFDYQLTIYQVFESINVTHHYVNATQHISKWNVEILLIVFLNFYLSIGSENQNINCW